MSSWLRVWTTSPSSSSRPHDTGDGAGVQVQQLRELSQRHTAVTADESNGQPLRRREPDPLHHSFRDPLQLVIDRPHAADEFEDQIRLIATHAGASVC